MSRPPASVSPIRKGETIDVFFHLSGLPVPENIVQRMLTQRCATLLFFDNWINGRSAVLVYCQKYLISLEIRGTVYQDCAEGKLGIVASLSLRNSLNCGFRFQHFLRKYLILELKDNYECQQKYLHNQFLGEKYAYTNALILSHTLFVAIKYSKVHVENKSKMPSNSQSHGVDYRTCFVAKIAVHFQLLTSVQCQVIRGLHDA